MTASTERSPSAIPVLYSSEAGERAVRAQYAAALAALPFPHQERLIHTESFGAVHVIISGRSSAPPLMLWHAAAAPAPYAIACLAPLVARFRVFAPDLPCQPGSRSEPVVLDPDTHAYGRWCAEVVEGLGLLRPRALPPVHVGICLGGAALLDLAAALPDAISGAALIVPIGLHPDSGNNRWLLARLVVQLLLPALLYRLLPCHWTAWLALACLCDEPLSSGGWVECLRMGLRHVAYFPAPPHPLSNSQLQRLRAPTLVLTAELDLLGGGAAAAERAQRVLPHCEACILRGARHVISGRWQREAVRRVATFFLEQGLMPPLAPPPPSRRRAAAAAKAAPSQAVAGQSGRASQGAVAAAPAIAGLVQAAAQATRPAGSSAVAPSGAAPAGAAPAAAPPAAAPPAAAPPAAAPPAAAAPAAAPPAAAQPAAAATAALAT